ncbi:MAG: LemA family protein, partial [Dehalococcoidales bacterium]|nr:LemA family protein [Dehalococcoidales bacterium]
MNIFAVVLGILLALMGLFFAFRSYRHKRLIDDTPTSKTQGVFIGLAELKGTAESETPFTGYLSGTRCVHYSYQVQEQWSRMVTETYTDSKGHTHTRTRRETGWKTVGSGGESAPFFIKDDTGVIRVVPDGANINEKSFFNQTCSPNDPLYFSKGPAYEIANTDHRRRFTETGIPLHAELYVMGQARERQDAVAAEIAQDKVAPMFIISVKSERQLSRGYLVGFWVWLFVGLLFAAGGAIGWQLLNDNVMTMWQPYVIAVGGYLVVLGTGWLWTVYNSLVNLQHRVEQAWSQVDIQLKRRNDLIPNLVQTVKGYGTHESETQKMIAELWAQTTATPPGAAGLDFKGFMPTLNIIVE